MTKEQIIDLIKAVSDKKDNSGTYIIQDIYFEGIANRILSQVDREQKEQARNILEKVNKAIDRIDDYGSRHTAKSFIAEIADEYRYGSMKWWKVNFANGNRFSILASSAYEAMTFAQTLAEEDGEGDLRVVSVENEGLL